MTDISMEEWALEVERGVQTLAHSSCHSGDVGHSELSRLVGISRLANCHQGVLCAQTHQIRECMLLNTNADDDADDSDADDEDYVYRTENIFFHENCKNKTQCQLCKRLA